MNSDVVKVQQPSTPALKSVTPEAVFQVRGVSKVYRMGEIEVHALRAVDLDLYSGEFAVLLGASGSGKSTLLNILGGLDVPSEGSVAYRDHVLTTADDSELTRFRREHVGFVFQFYNLIPSLTALENVELITEISENPISAREALELVGLNERLNHFPASSPAANSSASRSQERSQSSPMFCSATSRPAPLILRPARSCLK